MYIKRSLLILLLVASATITNAQKGLEFSIGPEFLHSFNHDEIFRGIGATAQAHYWVREPLALGIKTGVLSLTGSDTYTGVTRRNVSYTAIPVLVLIRYPIPIVENLYGQDDFGYTFTQNAVYESTGEAVTAGATYYFSLGYVIKDRFDIAAKVGRSRFNKNSKTANVNEFNLGLRLAVNF